jgi:hypothetical protein
MNRTSKNKLVVLSLALGVVAFGTSAYAPSAPAPKGGGLKMLPKEVSHDDLMAIMHDFEASLGFDCSDCHAKSTTRPGKLDFASDANPTKGVTLEMMKMVVEINKKHFGVKGKFADNYLQGKYKITCYTCHHGGSHPPVKAPAEKHD